MRRNSIAAARRGDDEGFSLASARAGACLWVMALWFAAAGVRAAVGVGESPEFVVNLTDPQHPVATVGYPNVGVAMSGDLVVDLRGVLVRGGFAESGDFTVNLLGATGGLSVAGTVTDGATGRGVAGATVEVGGKSGTSGASGGYRVEGLAAGTYTLSADKDGYVTFAAPLTVPAGTAVERDIALVASGAPGGAPRVTRVMSKYPGTPHFLAGVAALNVIALPVDLEVEFTANVDWAGHPPGTVRFVTPRRTYEVPATVGGATQRVNITADFGVDARLEVVAVGGDGVSSAGTAARMVVTPLPLPWIWYAQTPALNTELKYQAVELNFEFINQGVEDGIIPEDFPIFGGKAFKLGFVPEIEGEVDAGGLAEFALRWSDLEAGKVFKREWGRDHNFGKLSRLIEDYLEKGRLDRRRLPKAAVAGKEFYLFPVVEVSMQYNDAARRWGWRSGSLGLGGRFEYSVSRPFILMAGPVPVPMYAKVKLEASGEAMIEVLSLQPVRLNGDLTLEPYVRGSLGAGIDQVLSIEGWVGGGAALELQWPEEPTVKEMRIYLNGGVTVYAFLFKWEKEALRWDWPDPGAGGGLAWANEAVVVAAPVGRDYLSAPDYGLFVGGQPRAGLSDTNPDGDGRGRRVALATLQKSVFPYSEPDCAAYGTNLVLVWLYDQPGRAANDRALLVSSRFNGIAWTDPVAVADDGTADFHGDTLMFEDGWAVAVWENERGKMPVEATFEDMKRNLEIAVAWQEPTGGRWSPATGVVTNDYLDRSPRVGGLSRTNLLLTWVGNTNNHVTGSAVDVNQLWFSRWDGTTWSEARVAVEVPYPLLKYDVAFDGSDGVVVMSLDTDGDGQTVTDHELFRVQYADGAWGTLERLTTDGVADDNPRLARDNLGVMVLVWLHGDALQSATDFDLGGAQGVHGDEYSSNLADFRLASDGTGRLALLWIEPSEYSSDLWAVYYDPTFQVWGKPRQITHDPETERWLTAAYFGDDRLVAVYDRTAVTVTNRSRAMPAGGARPLSIPTPGTTDLCVLQHRFGQDLALGGFESIPVNPGPGETARLQVTVRNDGDAPVELAVVAFYNGDPAHGGVEIGRQQVLTGIRPGDTALVTLDWTVPGTSEPIVLYAQADPDMVFEDGDRANNGLELTLARADLAVSMVTCEESGGGLWTVTARVTNGGAIGGPTATLGLRVGTGATNLVSAALGTLGPGESRDVSFRLDLSGATEGVDLRVALELGGSLNDDDPSNNAASIRLQLPVVEASLWLDRPAWSVGNGFGFEVRNGTGRAFRIEASTNLVDWLPVTGTNLPSGAIEWTDTDSPWMPRRFYRAVAP